MNSASSAVTDEDIDGFVRTSSRLNGWRGTEGLYQALFSDHGSTRALAETRLLSVPVLTVDGASYPFTENTFRRSAQPASPPCTSTVRDT